MNTNIFTTNIFTTNIFTSPADASVHTTDTTKLKTTIGLAASQARAIRTKNSTQGMKDCVSKRFLCYSDMQDFLDTQPKGLWVSNGMDYTVKGVLSCQCWHFVY